MENNISDDSAVNTNEAGISVKQQEQVPEQPQEIDPAIIDFYQRYSLPMKAWAKEKGNTNFPIYEDPIDGKLKWANREMRKKHRKARNK